MSTSMTLLQVRTAARQRADMENSQFVGDPELTSYINQSYFELYDLLVQKYGSNYFISAPYLIATDGLNAFYPLPVDFYKLAGLSVRLSGAINQFVPLLRGSFAEMQTLQGLMSGLPLFSYDMKYSLQANNLWLAPMPGAGQIVQIFYVPRLTQLSADTDTLDGISGWTEFVICDAAIKCMQKEESPCEILLQQRAALIKRIEDAAANRDASSPSVVSDANTSYRSGWGFNGY
jgi:hypothetical protein